MPINHKKINPHRLFHGCGDKPPHQLKIDEEGNKRKKILFIITQSEFGGAQRFLCNLAAGLNRSKYDFVVAAGPQGNDKNGLLWRLQRKNIKTYPFQYLKREINLINDIKAFFEIRRLIYGLKPNIIYLNSSKAGIIGSLVSRICANFPLISRIHPRKLVENPRPLVVYRIGGWAFNEPLPKWKKWLYILAEKWTAKYKDIIITNSKADQKKAIELGIKPKDKIITIYNGIDAASLKFLSKEEAREKLFINTNTNTQPRAENRNLETTIIGCIANFYPSKGLEYLIETAAILESRIKNQESRINFVIVGDGFERKKLEKLIKKYNLQNNFFLPGNIPDAYKYLKAFDIFVLPSIKEGMPWCLLEAMAAEIPVIATDTGGVSELFGSSTSKHNGILIQPNNSEQIAEAIQILLQNNDLTIQFAENAKKIIEEKFSLKKMIKENEKILDAATYDV